jgi:RNA polymerase subunit RPABC4/transcription elongation factor Spt4
MAVKKKTKRKKVKQRACVNCGVKNHPRQKNCPHCGKDTKEKLNGLVQALADEYAMLANGRGDLITTLRSTESRLGRIQTMLAEDYGTEITDSLSDRYPYGQYK